MICKKRGKPAEKLSGKGADIRKQGFFSAATVIFYKEWNMYSFSDGYVAAFWGFRIPFFYFLKSVC
ncbi:hypothetical protein CVN76_27435 [Bacillus sp. mrc49]|nr:hypothetical protein CVN76_27435 [Bacillus sp. mrc49]